MLCEAPQDIQSIQLKYNHTLFGALRCSDACNIGYTKVNGAPGTQKLNNISTYQNTL